MYDGYRLAPFVLLWGPIGLGLWIIGLWNWYKRRFAWLLTPASLALAVLCSMGFLPFRFMQRDRHNQQRLEGLIARHAGQRLIDVDGDYWYDDIGYLVKATSSSPNRPVALLSLEGVCWSDGGVHEVPVDRPFRIRMDTCDLAMAFPVTEEYWYLYLNH